MDIQLFYSHCLVRDYFVFKAIVYTFIITIIVKFITLPLATQQIESTTKLQKLTPLQQKIQTKFASDETRKNQLLSQLFQVANVNPLAGCFPALVQIPIFISLYRALQNLVAEDKLNEAFLWIPNLEGPAFRNPPETSLDWLKSAVTGAPTYGWHDTIAYLSLPFILFISQTISQKILQPARDPNKPMTEQEQFSQGLVSNLPLIVAFFSLNVPAGLGIYWVVNNILTTLITLIIKEGVKNEQLPVEVDQMMALIDGPDDMKTTSSSRGTSYQELRYGDGSDSFNKKKDGFGFSKTFDTEIVKDSEDDLTSDESASGAESDNSDDVTTDSEVSATNSDSKKKRKSKRRKN